MSSLAETARPTIYATLGTEVSKEPGIYPDVLQKIIAGIRDLPANLIVTVGREKDPADLGLQPPNVHVERYISQSLLLPLCDLAVMHGGSNSLLQTIDAGLLVVVLPLIADQYFNAHVTQSLGLGEVVQSWQAGRLELGQLTPGGFRAAVERVLGDPLYRQNVARLQAEMHALPGLEHAVELVEQVALSHEPVINTDLETSL